jgi:MFS family permease
MDLLPQPNTIMSTRSNPTPLTPSTGSGWGVIFAMSGSMGLVLMDKAVVSVVLVDLAAGLGVGVHTAIWTITIFYATLAGSLLIGSAVASRIGHRTTFLLGMAVYGGSAVAAGLAPSIEALIVIRGIMGCGVGLMQPSSAAIVAHTARHGDLGSRLGAYQGIGYSYLIVGPVVGGFLNDWLSWQWAFWMFVPIVIISMLLTLRYVERDTPQAHAPHGAFNLLLALLAVGGLPATVQLMGDHDWGNGLTLSVGGLTTIAWILLAIRQFRGRSPLVSRSLLANRQFLGGSLVILIVAICLACLTVFAAIYLTQELGFSSLQSAIGLLPLFVPTAVMIYLTGRLYDRFAARYLIIAGAAFLAGGLIWQAAVLGSDNYLSLIIPLILSGIGSALLIGVGVADSLAAASSSQRGEAAAITKVFRQVGASVGIAAFTALLASGFAPIWWISAAIAASCILVLPMVSDRNAASTN